MNASESMSIEAADPSTSATRLAQIAADRPDLGAEIADHPQVYDGLLDWLSAYGDERARAAVARRRAAPTAPSAPPRPPLPAQSAGDAAALHDTAEQAAGDPQKRQTAKAETAAGAAKPAQKRRRGLILGGIAARVVVLLVIAVVVGIRLFRGSPTAQAAAEKVVNSIVAGDVLGLATSFAPSEMSSLKSIVDTLGNVTADDEDQVDYLQLISQLHESLTVTTTDMEYETEAITDGVVAVTLVGGIITIDADPQKLASALTDLTTQTTRGVLSASGYGDQQIDEQLVRQRRSLAADIADQYPITFRVAEEARKFEGGLAQGGTGASAPTFASPFTVVAVDEGGWYVSPLLTYAEILLRLRADAGDQDVAALRGTHVVEPAHFDTPDAAVDGVAAAIERVAVFGDTDDLAEVVTLPERRLLSLYGGPLGKYFAAGSVRNGATFTVSDPTTASHVEGDRALVNVSDLTFSHSGENSHQTIEWNDGCWSSVYTSDGFGFFDSDRYTSEGSGCLSDWRGAKPLGLEHPVVVAVHEDGGWLVSPLSTVLEAADGASEGIATLAKNDRLDELWESR